MAIGPGSLRSKVPTVLASVAGILLLALAMDAIFQVGQNAYLAALVATFAGVLAGLPLALYVDRLQQRQEEKVRWRRQPTPHRYSSG